MLITLIGYRGSGKSAVAQQLGLRLGWDWVDADVEIELRAGKSIAAIFTDDGEAAFRDLESGVLHDLLVRERTVVALGGGIVLRDANREQLRMASRSGHGKIVWLQAPAEVLWERIAGDAATAARRPNLTVAGGLKEVQTLLAEREPLYRACANVVVDTEGKSAAGVAEEIIESLGLSPES